jgi:hypothetical protein
MITHSNPPNHLEQIQTELHRLLNLYTVNLNSLLDYPESQQAPSHHTSVAALRSQSQTVEHLVHFIQSLPKEPLPNNLQLQIALTALPPLAGFVIQPDGGSSDELANICFSIANSFIKKSQNPS